MAAPNKSTFDLVPPIRPGTNTFNGIAKVDDENEPPDPTTMPNAAEWNTIEWLILAIGRVMPVAVLSVLKDAVQPTLAAFGVAPKAAVIGTFTITRNSVGNVSITWPAGTFPTSTMLPTASLNEGPGMIHALNITNGVQVFTYNSAGSLADKSFTVSVY